MYKYKFDYILREHLDLKLHRIQDFKKKSFIDHVKNYFYGPFLVDAQFEFEQNLKN